MADVFDLLPAERNEALYQQYLAVSPGAEVAVLSLSS